MRTRCQKGRRRISASKEENNFNFHPCEFPSCFEQFVGEEITSFPFLASDTEATEQDIEKTWCLLSCA